MDVEQIRTYCLRKDRVTEEFPFGNSTLVFKVNGKIFLLMGLDRVPFQFNVKCDPTKAEELREQYPAIVPGYHMNKKHWNTVVIDGSLNSTLIREMIDHSYSLVAKR